MQCMRLSDCFDVRLKLTHCSLSIYLNCYYFTLFRGPCLTVCGLLILQPRTEPTPSAVRAQSSNPWTTRGLPFSIFTTSAAGAVSRGGPRPCGHSLAGASWVGIWGETCSRPPHGATLWASACMQTPAAAPSLSPIWGLPGSRSLCPSSAAAPGPVSSRLPAQPRPPASPQLCLQDLCSPRHPPPPTASPCPCGPLPPKASPCPSLAHPSSASLGSRQRGPGKAGPEPFGAPGLVGGAGSPGSASWGSEAVAPRELPEWGRLAWTSPTHCLLLDAPAPPRTPTHLGAGSSPLPAGHGLLGLSRAPRPACSGHLPWVIPVSSSPHQPPRAPGGGAGPALPLRILRADAQPEQEPRTVTDQSDGLSW